MEIHVRAMIEYLYTLKYTEAEAKSSRKCSHGANEAHIFDDPQCKLWPFGLSIALHVLADKYDIASLAQDASARLKHLLDQSQNFWDDDLLVVKHAYHHSRPNDKMREVITGFAVAHVNRPCPGTLVGLQ